MSPADDFDDIMEFRERTVTDIVSSVMFARPKPTPKRAERQIETEGSEERNHNDKSEVA